MVLTEATQWFKNGDHPQDESTLTEGPGGAQQLSEGKIVKIFLSLNIPGGRFCPTCGNVMRRHGLIRNGDDEDIVCPGDYIVTRRDGSLYKMTAKEFEALYEPTRPPTKVEES